MNDILMIIGLILLFILGILAVFGFVRVLLEFIFFLLRND